METYIITVNGTSYEVQVEKKGEASSKPAQAKAAPAAEKPVSAPAKKPAAAVAGGTAIKAGAAGKVWKVVASQGQAVKAGDTIVILEAMKMEIPVVATIDGTIASVDALEGQAVEAGDVLATIN